MVPRGTSATADAYLSPVLKEYINGFFKGFEDELKAGSSGARVEFMTSEGTLVEVENFSGLRSVISGPAGGVVGCAKTSWDEERKIPVIGYVALFFASLARISVLIRRCETDSIWAELRPIALATLDNSRRCTNRLRLECHSSRPRSTSTRSQLEEGRS